MYDACAFLILQNSKTCLVLVDGACTSKDCLVLVDSTNTAKIRLYVAACNSSGFLLVHDTPDCFFAVTVRYCILYGTQSHLHSKSKMTFVCLIFLPHLHIFCNLPSLHPSINHTAIPWITSIHLCKAPLFCRIEQDAQKY